MWEAGQLMSYASGLLPSWPLVGVTSAAFSTADGLELEATGCSVGSFAGTGSSRCPDSAGETSPCIGEVPGGVSGVVVAVERLLSAAGWVRRAEGGAKAAVYRVGAFNPF